MKKWAKDRTRRYSREDTHMASKYMKRCSTSLAIREMKIKTNHNKINTSYSLECPLKKTKNKKLTSVGEDME